MTLLIKSIVKAANHQFIEYIEFSKKLDGDILGRFFAREIPQVDLAIFLRIDSEKLFKYWSYFNLDQKELVNLIHITSYLDVVFSSLKHDLHEGKGTIVLDLTNKLIQIRNTALMDATDYLNIEKHKNPKHLEKPLWNIINDLVGKYHENNDGIPSVQYDYDNLINPIKDELIKDEYRYAKISDILLKFAKTGGDMVFTIRNFNEHLVKDINLTNDNMKSELEQLGNILLLIDPQSEQDNLTA